ncbi:MAG: tetraacyldisaccharide 4'-kinase [Pseudomonadota bacterium]
MRVDLSAAALDLWARQPGWSLPLWPLEACYRSLVLTRRLAYGNGWLPSCKVDKPVIVVGNVTLGGTGKTPVVMALVEALARHRLRAGVVSRGYGRTRQGGACIVNEHTQVQDCGDEPLMMYRRLKCPCVVATRRLEAARLLLDHFFVDVVICDDGLQHYAMQRDLEIAVVDSQYGYGNGRCLPIGPLREPLSRLAEVDFVLERAGREAETAVPFHLDALVQLNSGAELPASAKSLGRQVYAVAGVGQPALFLEALQQTGFEASVRLFGDHHRYQTDDFAGMNDRPIIMTEKDAVKCRGLVGDNAWYLKISAVLPTAVVDRVVSLAATQAGNSSA